MNYQLHHNPENTQRKMHVLSSVGSSVGEGLGAAVQAMQRFLGILDQPETGKAKYLRR